VPEADVNIKKETKGNRIGAGCLCLFALPFAGIGVFMAYLIISGFVFSFKARSWTETPARITSVSLKESRDDNSTTYKVEGSFSYTFEGKTYTSDRLSDSFGSDNLGSYHQDLHRLLKSYKDSGKPYRCYVNPTSPGDAVIDRGIRWAKIGFYAIFLVTFGGIGFWLMIGSVYAYRKLQREAQLAEIHVDQPWLCNEDWNDGIIKSENKGSMIGSVFFAVIWNAISCPVLFVIPKEMEKENVVVLIALIFPLVGLCLAVWAIKNIWRWFKYRESYFQMNKIPGVIGGAVDGQVLTRKNLIPEDGFHLELASIHKYSTGSGDNRSTRNDVLWQTSHIVEKELLESDMTRSVIPIHFTVPFDCRPTQEVSSDNEYLWKLTVKAAVPGLDYSADFQIPVFKTDESQENIENIAAEDQHKRLKREEPIQNVLSQQRIHMQDLPSGGVQLHFPFARPLGVCIGISIFFFIWTAVIAFMIHAKAPVLFPIVFGLFDLLIVFFVLDIWLYASRVIVNNRRLTLTAGFLGIGRPGMLEANEIERIYKKRGMQSGNTIFYQIVLKTKDGKDITLGKRVKNAQTADAIVDAIQSALSAD
jgi:hypothetical protein